MSGLIELEVTGDHAVPVTPAAGGTLTVLNQSGDTLFYGDTTQVSAGNNQGSLTATQSVTLSLPQWIRSASLSTVLVTFIDPAAPSGGGASGPSVVQMDSGTAPTVDHATALVDGSALRYDLASGKFKGAALLNPPAGAGNGDVPYFTGAGALAKATAGANGQVLTMVGGVPLFAGGGGGTTRQAMRDAARGYTGAVWDVGAEGAVGGSIPATQTLYGTLVGLLSGDVLTNIVVWVQTAAAGTTPTGIFFALYDLTGALLASTVDLHANAAWTTAGQYAFAFQSPYTVTSNGGAYLAALINGTWGTTQVKFGAQTSNVGQTRLSAGNSYGCVRQTGQSTLPGPATFSPDNANFWFGWS